MVLRSAPGDLYRNAEVGSRTSTGDADGNHSGRLPERVPLHQGAQGIFPAAGYGTHHGWRDGGARYLVPGDEREDAALRHHRHERPRGGYGGRVCRWQYCSEPGPFFYDAQTPGTTQQVREETLLATLPECDG